MTSGRGFAQTLDEMIEQGCEASPGRSRARARVATSPLWDVPGPVSRIGAHAHVRYRSYGSETRDVSVAARCAEPAPRPERVARIRPARRLTKAQLEALNTLQRLGASTLTQDFSGDQLRAAYRALAKRYHPDGRPGSSPAETARLASTFASLCDAYRELIGPSRDARTAANR